MALLGNVDATKRFLQAVDGDAFTGDQETRIAETLAMVSSLIESRIGRTFAIDPLTPESVLVSSYGITGELWLPKPVRAITGIIEATTWDGLAWSGSTVLAANYFLHRRDELGFYHSVKLKPGYAWNGDYLVTGTWHDINGAVPADLAYVANYVTAEIFKKQNASPAGYAGPDGTVVLFRDALNEPEIKAILAKYTAEYASVAV